MIDIKLIKENPEEIVRRFKVKGKDAAAEIARILELDGKRRALISETEALKAEQNRENKLIPQYKKEGKDVKEIFAKLKEIGAKSKAIDVELKEVEAEYNSIMLSLPNLPDPDLKEGGKENNEPLRYFGEPKTFDFTPKKPR